VMTALLWVWSDEPTLTARFSVAQSIARKLWNHHVTAAISYQAFLKRLVRWTDPLLQILKPVLRRSMREAFPTHWRVAGHCVFGVDGSKLELPRTRSHQARFSAGARRNGASRRRSRQPSRQSQQSRRRKLDSAQLLITTLWHAGTGLPWDWRLGPAHGSERGQLVEMLSNLPRQSLLTADAGFVGYSLWSELQGAGHDLLIRVGSHVRLLKKLGFVREAGNTVYLWPEECRRRLQPPLVLRLVVVQGARHPWYLVTSVRDRKQLGDREVAEIYRRRWRVEVFYRHFKQTFARRKLRSHTADHALCEAEWSMLGLWGMLLRGERQLWREERIAPWRMSVAGVLRAFRGLLDRVWWEAGVEGVFEVELSRSVLDEYARQDKRSRGYPQKKYEPPCRPPQLQTATSKLRKHSQKIKARIKAGLTA
jgi:hypothetical protein